MEHPFQTPIHIVVVAFPYQHYHENVTLYLICDPVFAYIHATKRDAM